MTEDAALLRLLSAASRAGAKVVMVGDHRQLGAVGPGGGFESLVARYGAAVHVLDENVRQRDVAERAALAAAARRRCCQSCCLVRARNGRIVAAPDRAAAIEAVVAGWAADVAEGHAGGHVRLAAGQRGRAQPPGPGGVAIASAASASEELVAPGGTPYAVGDRVVTLAPGAGGSVVTSETGTVVALDAKARRWSCAWTTAATCAGWRPRRSPPTAWPTAYAVTVHRSQGSTVQRAHALEDGGGRELAYVKMSRAKDRSTVYVVADDVEQAVEDLRPGVVGRAPAGVGHRLRHAGDRPRRRRGQPAGGQAHARRPAPWPPGRRASRHRRRHPSDPSAEIRAVEKELARIRRQREDLAAGKGRYADGPVGHAVWELGRPR